MADLTLQRRIIARRHRNLSLSAGATWEARSGGWDDCGRISLET